MRPTGILIAVALLLGTGPAAPAETPVEVELDDAPAVVADLAAESPFPTAAHGRRWAGGPDEPGACGWLEAEFLLWWLKPAPLPGPLVTSGPAASGGVLGQPDTTVLAGGEDVGYGPFLGARLTAGFWLNHDRTVAIEGRGFALAERSQTERFRSGPVGELLLARPVINAVTGEEAAALVSSAGAFTGEVGVRSASRLWGAEANLVRCLPTAGHVSFSLLAGVRYAELDEELTVSQSSTVLAGGAASFLGQDVPPGSAFGITDRFGTRNQFFGGQLGGRLEVRHGPLFADVRATVALGVSEQDLEVDGLTTLGMPGLPPTQTTPGGLLAVGSNGGRRSDSGFAVMPEVGVNVGCQFTPRIRAAVGYTFLYWSDVVRPGDQVSRVVNQGQVPASVDFGAPGGPPAPAPRFEQSSFWAQGFNLSVGFQY